MNGKFLLDTSVVIGLFESDAEVLRMFDSTGEYFISATVLGELKYGAANSTRKIANLKRISDFCETVGCFSCDRTTSSAYGKIKASLRAKGKPIPENDIWISAVAKQHELTLLTRDTHFEFISDIELIKV